MNRATSLRLIHERHEPWDLIVIGGGATGVGIAVDGAARGYEVVLLEQSEFGKGTSSRTTKLVHGGVRYLQQGNISLVMEALKERGLQRAQPELAAPLHPALPIAGAEVVWSARHEMARTVDDVLARWTRALALNARAAISMALTAVALRYLVDS